MAGTITKANTSGNTAVVGYDNEASGAIADGLTFSASAAVNARVNAANVGIGTYEANTPYRLHIVSRTSGMFYFMENKLVYISSTGTGGLVPAINTGSTSAVFTVDNFRVPKTLYIPAPLQSDGFSASTTDGAGNAEANGPVGNAWTNQIGTWGVSGGKKVCSALPDGYAISTLDAGTSNVIIDVDAVRVAGASGMVARYVDLTNFIMCYTDGTLAWVIEKVNGSSTTLLSSAITYSAGATLRFSLDGTKARVFYNNAAVGGELTVVDRGNKHGTFVTSTSNTLDNFVVWARGSEGQYSDLNTL